MGRGGPRVSASAHEIQLALKAPRRPETSGCTLCGEKCMGGRCANWRERRTEWVQLWDGRPLPDDDEGLSEWWTRAKARHKLLVAAAAPNTTASKKRPAAADGTPNGGGQRKDAPLSATRAARHELELPTSLDESGGVGSGGHAALAHPPADELISLAVW